MNNKENMMRQLIISLIGLLLVCSSCSDALIEDYILGTWEMQSYARNDVDETSKINILDYQESYTLDGTISRSYIDGKQVLVEESGKYSINEDKNSIHISDLSSIADFTDEHSTLSTSTAEVKTIDDVEFVYTFENGGDSHEFRFIKKE